MKTINEIINQPTVSDGSFKDTLWTTALKKSIDNDTLAIETNETGAIYTVDNKQHHVSTAILALANCEKVYAGKATLSPERLFSLQSQDFLIPLQQTVATSEKNQLERQNLLRAIS